jgi:hypothetical protein
MVRSRAAHRGLAAQVLLARVDLPLAPPDKIGKEQGQRHERRQCDEHDQERRPALLRVQKTGVVSCHACIRTVLAPETGSCPITPERPMEG